MDVLVLDEVSMLSAELLTVLDFMARKLRHRPEPFGGIQLVLCGDFLQLPPVSGGQHSSFGKACAGLDSDGEGEEEEKEGSEEESASDDENPPTHSQEEHRRGHHPRRSAAHPTYSCACALAPPPRTQAPRAPPALPAGLPAGLPAAPETAP